jgi:phosphinothricin acetyltransferase
MIVRPAVAADVPAITEIANALVPTTTIEWSETLHSVGERTAWMADQQAAGHPVLVAIDGGSEAAVGWATYGNFRDTTRWPGYRFTVEHSVHVAEHHWGRGVGRALMVALIDTARGSGKRVMVGAIDAGNVASLEFHARLGFVEVGRMPGIGDKWGQRLDLVLMQLDVSEQIG